jgi:hypothetical protein
VILFVETTLGKSLWINQPYPELSFTIVKGNEFDSAIAEFSGRIQYYDYEILVSECSISQADYSLLIEINISSETSNLKNIIYHQSRSRTCDN